MRSNSLILAFPESLSGKRVFHCPHLYRPQLDETGYKSCFLTDPDHSKQNDQHGGTREGLGRVLLSNNLFFHSDIKQGIQTNMFRDSAILDHLYTVFKIKQY